MTRMNPARPVLVAVVLLGAWTAQAAETSKVMGSIDVAAGEHAGDVSTVNGSIEIGENAVIGSAHTVNGGIELGRHATARELTTVNGSVAVREAARVTGAVSTVNGKLTVEKDADIAGALGNVNGEIKVIAAHVGGEIATTSGGMELGPNAHVDGGLHVSKDSSWISFVRKSVPRIVIGPGSVVRGTLRFERTVKLYVSERATIGSVEGATAIRFATEAPAD